MFETRFVVHEHNARKAGLHHDLRIELNGVLVSFAIPKLIDEKERRLALKVEDHDISYFDFEGVIEEGYGAGTVTIYDTGNCKVEQKKEGYKIEFFGTKLIGCWTLRSFATSSDKYLFFKSKNSR